MNMIHWKLEVFVVSNSPLGCSDVSYRSTNSAYYIAYHSCVILNSAVEKPKLVKVVSSADRIVGDNANLMLCEQDLVDQRLAPKKKIQGQWVFRISQYS